MATIVITKKLYIKEALNCMKQVEQWFRENPSRKVCKTDHFSVRKGFLVSDILKYTESV